MVVGAGVSGLTTAKGLQYLGYYTLPKYLSNRLQIIFNEKVSKIKYSSNSVEIITENQKYIADYVVVTASLGILKSGNIKFDPKLPSKKIA
ncbi:FAD-dependent oxidoreductase [Romboutsia sp.]|uniref:FAD-dependent oxidoreductase n=1 Tax=Romboutsia sp. TaxID=1965302 RepID=UPI003F38990D